MCKLMDYNASIRAGSRWSSLETKSLWPKSVMISKGLICCSGHVQLAYSMGWPCSCQSVTEACRCTELLASQQRVRHLQASLQLLCNQSSTHGSRRRAHACQCQVLHALELTMKARLSAGDISRVPSRAVAACSSALRCCHPVRILALRSHHQLEGSQKP